MMTRKKLSELEAMSELGIQKMVSGSFTVVEGELRVDTYVVDVASGVLEVSYPTVGAVGDFHLVRNQALVEAIERLDLPVTDEERSMLAASSKRRVDSLRRILRSEGAGRAVPRMGPPAPDSHLESRSPFQASWVAMAHAATGTAAEDQIRAVLESYRSATEKGDVDALRKVYSDYPEELREAQKGYFASVRDLQVQISDLEIVVIGDEAVASYTRSDDFFDLEMGEETHVDVRLTKTLVRRDGGWLLVLGE